MKRFVFPIALLFSLASFGQMKEGKIIYERVMQISTRTFTNLDPAIAAQIPKSRTDQYELLFANNQSLWQNIPSAGGEDITASGNGTFIRVGGGMNEVAFHDFSKGTRVTQRDVMDRSFIVSDSITRGDWKLTDETKTILNLNARKAVGSRISTRSQMSMENGEMKRIDVQDTTVVIAWFTTDIPVSVGPEMQGQLPGAILELDINNGQMVYKAVEVSAKVNTKQIREPKDGKKVSAAEFVKERDKIMDEMRKNMQGGSIRIMN